MFNSLNRDTKISIFFEISKKSTSDAEMKAKDPINRHADNPQVFIFFINLLF
jgi:hypothetical protein